MILAWGVVARRSQPHLGDAPSSRLAPSQNQRNERERICELDHLGWVRSGEPCGFCQSTLMLIERDEGSSLDVQRGGDMPEIK